MPTKTWDGIQRFESMGNYAQNNHETKTVTMANKKSNTIHVPAFGIDVDAVFAPIAGAIKPNAHGAFVMLIITAYPNAMKIDDLIQWQMSFAPDKYPAKNPTSPKRARGNVAAHIQNANAKSKSCNFADCGLILRKTIDGFRLLPIE